jgi:hypothetical protein
MPLINVTSPENNFAIIGTLSILVIATIKPITMDNNKEIPTINKVTGTADNNFSAHSLIKEKSKLLIS